MGRPRSLRMPNDCPTRSRVNSLSSTARSSAAAGTGRDAVALARAGAEVLVESGLGAGCGYADEEYRTAGAGLVGGRSELLEAADLVLRLNKPSGDEVAQLQPGAVHISFLDPFNERALVEALRDRQVSAVSMEMVPRTTRAQKMDALSSQASLAGYVMTIQAANRLNRILPMMMTPSGTIKPTQVFVIGAGVAGLAAVGAAKNLGAVVRAFDTREACREQVQSLGGEFLTVDIAESGEGAGAIEMRCTDDCAQLHASSVLSHSHRFVHRPNLNQRV